MLVLSFAIALAVLDTGAFLAAGLAAGLGRVTGVFTFGVAAALGAAFFAVAIFQISFLVLLANLFASAGIVISFLGPRWRSSGEKDRVRLGCSGAVIGETTDWQGLRPMEQVTFQFSCHIQRTPGDEFEHHEFIDLSGNDPTLACLEAMLKVMTDDGGSILVYYATYERTRMLEM